MKTIPLTQGLFALIDDEDFERVSKYRWFAARCRNTHYARRNQWNKELKRDTTKSMHRFIMSAEAGVEIDHRDGNGLNNQKSNLRPATDLEQGANKLRAVNNTTGFKGVMWHSRDKIYEVSIRRMGKAIYLGRTHSLEEAVRRYDEAAVKLFGEFAKTNQMLSCNA